MTATNPWTNLSKKLKIKKKIMTLDHQKKKKSPIAHAMRLMLYYIIRLHIMLYQWSISASIP